MRRSIFAVFISLACACGSEGTTSPPPDPGADGPAPGYIRLRTTPITLQPGESGQWGEWVHAPLDRDMDLADVSGWQSEAGHHAVVYGVTEAQPIGTRIVWNDAEQADAHFLGGTGGEGGTAFKPPEGVVLRVPAGSALLVQTHWINTSERVVVGEAYIDVKLLEPVPGKKVASFFAATTLDVEVAPGAERTRVVDCVLPRDLRLFRYVNHMHRAGVSIRTTLLDGEHERVLKDDPVWDYEWANNPNFETKTAETPELLPAGSTLHIECNFRNTSGKTLAYPDEMCVFFGFVESDHDIACAEGQWYE